MSRKISYNQNNRSVTMKSGKLSQGLSVPSGGFVPVGGILAWIGGYYTDSSNSGYTPVLAADTISAANNYLKQFGFAVCDGSVMNDPESPFWNSPTTYLPQLTDGRFLHGSLTVGSGGSSTIADHTHTLGTLAMAPESAHTHLWPKPQSGTLGAWSVDDSSVFTGDNGDGSTSVITDGLFSWGLYYGDSVAAGSGPAHSHQMYCTANSGPAIRVSYRGETFSAYLTTGAHTDFQQQTHTHQFQYILHRHLLSSDSTSIEYKTEGSPTRSHNHTVSGNAGTGPLSSATNNEPSYLNCLFIVRFK